MTRKRDISISLIRVAAMFMIISDHILCKLAFPMQSLVVQTANSGVFIFLFISGYLYGKKEIENWGRWFYSRMIRICIPMWIFMAVDFAVEAIVCHQFSLRYVFIYLFNLQGILGVNAGGVNLWFLTLIMICYIITPMLQWIKSKNPGRMIGIIIILSAIALDIILAYTTKIGMVANHSISWCMIAVAMYVTGYFAGDSILSKNMGCKRIGIVTILAAVATFIVLISNKKLDGQILYDKVIAFYGMVFVDLWICTVLYYFGIHIREGIIRKVIEHFDKISYEFYLVHGIIILLITRPLIESAGAFVYIFYTVIISYLAAWVLHGICMLIYKKI